MFDWIRQLLGMSASSWVIILWKTWLLRRARLDVARSTAAFWQAADLADGQRKVQARPRACAEQGKRIAAGGPKGVPVHHPS